MLEQNKIHCGDCIDILQQVDTNSVDLVLTDPPFNVGLEYGNIDDAINDEAYSDWCHAWIKELHRVLKEGHYCLIFTGDKKLFYVMKAIYKTPFLFHHFIKWHKPSCQRALSGTVFFNRTELCFVLSKGPPDISLINRKKLHSDTLTHNNNTPIHNDAGTICDHPASRPVKLYRHLIEGFKCQNVLDCFMGSGTTAIACKQLGKDFIGMEINPEYIKIANERMQQEQLKSWF